MLRLLDRYVYVMRTERTHAKHPFPNKVLQSGGAAWKLLMMARSLRFTFTVEDLSRINAQFTPRYASKPLARLTELALLYTHVDGSYQITREGVRYLELVAPYWVARELVRKREMRDVD